MRLYAIVKRFLLRSCNKFATLQESVPSCLKISYGKGLRNNHCNSIDRNWELSAESHAQNPRDDASGFDILSRHTYALAC